VDTEEYDGSTWTAGGNLNTARFETTGAGLQTAALAFGGAPPPTGTGATEEYNGSTWTSVASLTTARRFLSGMGIHNSRLASGGQTTPSVTGATEEWTGAGAAVTKTITVS
jgi:hypothetical protein